MKLTYRGISYQSSATPIQSNKSETIAKFRDQSYQVSQPIVSKLSCSHLLKYRGIRYQSGYSNLDLEKILNQITKVNRDSQKSDDAKMLFDDKHEQKISGIDI